MLIDNAFYACIPSEGGQARKAQEEPAMNQFIKKMVQNVTEESVDQRIKMLRRLNWLNEEVSSSFSMFSLSKKKKFRFMSPISLLALARSLLQSASTG